jgi:ABC-2 type transport system ATP-binding protein
VRELLRDLADEGRTVLVSSHLMSEMEDTADHLVVLGRGRLLADVPVADLLAGYEEVRVASPAAAVLAAALERFGADVEPDGPDTLRVHGLDVAEVGDVAFECGVRLHELSRVTVSLEEAYLALTRDEVEYRAGAR